MSHQVRVTFDEDDWEDMVEHAPTALRDPETVRHYVSLGVRFQKVREEGLRGVESSDLRELATKVADVMEDEEDEKEAREPVPTSEVVPRHEDAPNEFYARLEGFLGTIPSEFYDEGVDAESGEDSEE